MPVVCRSTLCWAMQLIRPSSTYDMHSKVEGLSQPFHTLDTNTLLMLNTTRDMFLLLSDSTAMASCRPNSYCLYTILHKTSKIHILLQFQCCTCGVFGLKQVLQSRGTNSNCPLMFNGFMNNEKPNLCLLLIITTGS